jgi:hypothetical protein
VLSKHILVDYLLTASEWAEIQPRPGEFDFSAGDTIVKLAHANGQLLRCHALVWYQDLPYWVTNGQWNRQSLIAALWTHITTVVNHYKSTCYAWDVVNEALAEDGSLHDNIFLNVIGCGQLRSMKSVQSRANFSPARHTSPSPFKLPLPPTQTPSSTTMTTTSTTTLAKHLLPPVQPASAAIFEGKT